MEFFLSHLREDSDRRERRRKDRRRGARDKSEEIKKKGGGEGAAAGCHSGPPSDGIRLPRHGCGAETRRETRAGRKGDGDVVIGSGENGTRTHPSGRQQPTPESIKATRGGIIHRITTLLPYMGHLSAPGARLRGVIATNLPVSSIMAFEETAAP